MHSEEGPSLFLSYQGSGMISVDHDYGGTDNLRYTTSDGNGIGDATIQAYLASTYDEGDLDVVASATTESDGRWGQPMLLDPDTYVLIFSKAGIYGPDTTRIAVRDPSDETDQRASGAINDCEAVCGSVCEPWIFSRVRVRPLVAGGTRLEWELHDQFTDSEPHTFQLQVGRTAVPDADDWVDVGLDVEDAYYLVDDEQRVFGKTQWTHYRIKLTTLEGTYYSSPVSCLGDLSFRDWRLSRSIIRSETVRFRQLAGQLGYLLKRRVAGEKCTECRDHVTDEVVNAQCEECYGTGWLHGYFEPKECVWAALDEKTRHEELKKERATANDVIVNARMLAEPQLNEEDVWVDQKTDIRWFVHKIEHIVEIRGYPIVYQVELRMAEFSNPIYGLEIEDQVPS
jgi:hypothetical protein